ncbi:hypothetical protein PV408_48430, partial [Streptomyces sp. ME18-1-4]|nr:hypothetical protein [Streptomyces sp. ME18-1-4]
MRRNLHRTFYGAVVVVGALLASAACSSPDAGDAGDTGPKAAATRMIRPVEGCGAASWTDPANLSPTRT